MTGETLSQSKTTLSLALRRLVRHYSTHSMLYEARRLQQRRPTP